MKKKTLLIIALILITNLLLSACILPFISVVRGSGNVISENREVSGFSEIVLDGFGELIITQGESESLKIEAEDNVMPELTSTVEGATLELGFEEKTWDKQIIPTKPVIYTLTVIDLTSITINGAADMEIAALETDSFSLLINGAGDFTIEDLNADTLKVQINGSANIDISGSVTKQTITFDGAGKFDSADLASSETVVTFNGVGDATVWVTESLDITINGGGELNYYGSPNVTQDINGAGDINNLGEK